MAVERDINNRPRLRVLDQLEIDRLLLDGLITMDQHTAGEHLYRLVTSAGYFPACKWAMDSNIRSSGENISHHRAMAFVKIGLAKVWLRARAGAMTTTYLWSVVLGERKVDDRLVPVVQSGLNAYRSFEGWWHERDTDQSIPALLSDMPARIQSHLPRSFHDEVR